METMRNDARPAAAPETHTHEQPGMAARATDACCDAVLLEA